MSTEQGPVLAIEKENGQEARQKQSVSFILALHNHQPVGNLPEVFSKAFEEAYAPFVDILYRFPSIKAVLHYSGILLEWIEKNRPSFFSILREMVERDQVEIMGGTFYEAILPIIPDGDKRGQIHKLNRFLQDKLGATVRGMWLTERIWEPHLARPLCQAGIEYVVVDDAHFQELGLKSEELTGYYLTEEQGYPLKIFPISEKLRYLIPFEKADKTMEFLSHLSTKNENAVAVLADDGEKFGVWPGTKEHVYDQGWLEGFFSLLTENEDWIKTTTFKDFMENHPPKGRIYLPAASYREMKSWAGGFWRNFLVRYPESNRMHKKMLAVRKRLKDISQEAPRKRARDLVWASQCNCAYWHGVFGGLYLNFLRASVYENLIKAENIIVRETHENDNWLEMKIEDRDYDGFQEIVLGNEYLALLLSPEKGGSLWELSYRPAAVNLLDTLSRRPEPYHDDLLKQDIKPVNGDNGVATIHERLAVKEEGLKEYLVYDPYPRGALMDHILPLDLDLESFSRGDYTEIGDFLLKPYHTTLEYERGQATVIFSRRGKIEEQGDLFLRKIILLKASSNVININYDLQNEGTGTSSFRFGIEFNLAFLAGYAPDRHYRIPGRKIDEAHLASKGLEEDVTELYIFDEWRKMVFTLRFSTPAKLWRFPVETISQSEAGLERVYQQSVVVPTWELALSPQENIPITIELAINS